MIFTIGIFQFRNSSYSVYETNEQIQVMVVRKKGSSGDIDVPWTTTPESATDWEDYEGHSGDLRFGDSEVSRLPPSSLIIHIYIYTDAKQYENRYVMTYTSKMTLQQY